MEDADTELLLSAASGWEIAIKSRLGKLSCRLICKASLRNNCVSTAFRRCPSRWPMHCMCLRLPDHHRDPFDRTLVAQGQ